MDRISQRAQFQLSEVNGLATETECIAPRFPLAHTRGPRRPTTGRPGIFRPVVFHPGVFHPPTAPQQAFHAGEQDPQLQRLHQLILPPRPPSPPPPSAPP